MNIKCILLGDCKTGKSHFINYFRKNGKNPYQYIPTIGIDFFVYKTMHIWDSSGCDRFKTILRPFIQTSNLCIICYNDEKSFQSVKKYYEEIMLYGGRQVESICLISFTKDIELEVEGLVFANMRGCDFFTCNLDEKDSCYTMMNTLMEKYKRDVLKEKKIPSIKKLKPIENRSCWWNLW
tara:strand:- start:5029 stop:5568 length:540 start_codon:yes stop_codon:yes gene_type:complete